MDEIYFIYSFSIIFRTTAPSVTSWRRQPVPDKYLTSCYRRLLETETQLERNKKEVNRTENYRLFPYIPKILIKTHV